MIYATCTSANINPLKTTIMTSFGSAWAKYIMREDIFCSTNRKIRLQLIELRRSINLRGSWKQISVATLLRTLRFPSLESPPPRGGRRWRGASSLSAAAAPCWVGYGVGCWVRWRCLSTWAVCPAVNSARICRQSTTLSLVYSPVSEHFCNVYC